MSLRRHGVSILHGTGITAIPTAGTTGTGAGVRHGACPGVGARRGDGVLPGDGRGVGAHHGDGARRGDGAVPAGDPAGAGVHRGESPHDPEATRLTAVARQVCATDTPVFHPIRTTVPA